MINFMIPEPVPDMLPRLINFDLLLFYYIRLYGSCVAAAGALCIHHNTASNHLKKHYEDNVIPYIKAGRYDHLFDELHDLPFAFCFPLQRISRDIVLWIPHNWLPATPVPPFYYSVFNTYALAHNDYRLRPLSKILAERFRLDVPSANDINLRIPMHVDTYITKEQFYHGHPIDETAPTYEPTTPHPSDMPSTPPTTPSAASSTTPPTPSTTSDREAQSASKEPS